MCEWIRGCISPGSDEVSLANASLDMHSGGAAPGGGIVG